MRKRNSRCHLPSFLCEYAPYAENHWQKTTTVPEAKKNILPRELYRKKRVQFIDNCNYSGLPTAFIRIFEHFVFFPAFDKAKNAHKGVGNPIRTAVQEPMVLTCKHDNPLVLHSGPE